MKIGFITSEYPHPKVKRAAGIATSIKNLATSLVANNHKVLVFVYQQDEDDIMIADDVEIHLIKSRKYKLFGWYLYRKHINKYINNIVRKQNVSLLEAPDWTGITAFMKFEIPLIIRLHGSDAYFCKLDGRKQKFKNYLFEKFAIKNADAFIAPTTYAGEVSKEIFNINKKSVKAIHNGLFLEKFTNDNPKIFNSGEILYIGTLVRKKGVFELTKIFNEVIEKCPEAKLVLIGNDSVDQKTNSSSTWGLMVKQFSEKALKQVEYKGEVPYEEIQDYIKSANVCVFPTFAETMGMVTIESMALQKPVVNSNYGWALELIDDKVNGFLVDPENTKEYGRRIIELIKNKELSIKIGEQARIKVEKTFDINNLVDENIDYYKSIIQ